MMFDRWRRDQPLEKAAEDTEAVGGDGAESVEPGGGAGPVGAGDGEDAVEAVDPDAVGDVAAPPTTTLAPADLGRMLVPAAEVPGAVKIGGPALDKTGAGLDVDDLAAFMAGCLVEHRSDQGRGVPAWAVLNKVAHADVDELVRLADEADEAGAAGEAREPAWRSAQRSLATDLLEGRDPQEVARIQREVLAPLELWLIERSKTTTVSGRWAAEMAADVLSVCDSPRN